MGHSMGCSIIWSMISMYGESIFKNYICVDQSPALLINPLNSPTTNEKMGSIFTSEQLFNAYNILVGEVKAANAFKIAFVSTMFTEEFKKTNPQIVKVLYGNTKYNNTVSGQIVFNHVVSNWTDVLLSSSESSSSSIRKIKIPALLIGAKQSLIPYQSIERI